MPPRNDSTAKKTSSFFSALDPDPTFAKRIIRHMQAATNAASSNHDILQNFKEQYLATVANGDAKLKAKILLDAIDWAINHGFYAQGRTFLLNAHLLEKQANTTNQAYIELICFLCDRLIGFLDATMYEPEELINEPNEAFQFDAIDPTLNQSLGPQAQRDLEEEKGEAADPLKAIKASQESTEYRPTNENHEWLSEELFFRQASYKTKEYFHAGIDLDTDSILKIFKNLANHPIHGMTAQLYVAALENNSDAFTSLMAGLKKNPLAIARLRLTHPHLLYWENGLVNHLKMAEECRTFSQRAAEAGDYGVAKRLFIQAIFAIAPTEQEQE